MVTRNCVNAVCRLLAVTVMDELVADALMGKGAGVQPLRAALALPTEQVQVKLPGVLMQSAGAAHVWLPVLVHSSMSSQSFCCPLQWPSALHVTVAVPRALGVNPLLQLGVQLHAHARAIKTPRTMMTGSRVSEFTQARVCAPHTAQPLCSQS